MSKLKTISQRCVSLRQYNCILCVYIKMHMYNIRSGIGSMGAERLFIIIILPTVRREEEEEALCVSTRI